MRDPDDLITEALTSASDPDEFTPRLLALLSNALIWAQSRAFRADLGLGTNEWRVLAALATHPGQAAADVSASLSINKSTLSGSVNRLAREGYIALLEGPRGSRPMYLTRSGAAMHDRMAPIAHRGQALVDAELDADAVRDLNALLRRLIERARPDTDARAD